MLSLIQLVMYNDRQKIIRWITMQIYTDKYFENPAEVIEIFDPEKVKEGIDRVERLRDRGFFLLGYMRYNLNKVNQKGAPLVYFEAYKNYTKLSDITDSYTGENHRSEPAGTYLIPQITKDEYIRRIKYIKEQILNGITYEVNYTYPSVLKSNITGIEYNFPNWLIYTSNRLETKYTQRLVVSQILNSTLL